VLGPAGQERLEEEEGEGAEHGQVIIGPLLVLSVIFFRRGLAGIFYKPDA
jgi:ABC-type branched-subunit amino acid transport system permease subunit